MIYIPLIQAAHDAVAKLHHDVEMEMDATDSYRASPKIATAGVASTSAGPGVMKSLDDFRRAKKASEAKRDRAEAAAAQPQASTSAISPPPYHQTPPALPAALMSQSVPAVNDPFGSRRPDLIYDGTEVTNKFITSFVPFIEEWSKGGGKGIIWKQGAKIGPDHNPTFEYSVSFSHPTLGTKWTLGRGKTWKKAKNR